MSAWVAGAVVVGGVVGAVGSNMAANTQANAQNRATATQQNMFNTINQQEQPFMQAGYGATTQLSDLLGTSGNTNAPNYGYLNHQFSPQDFQNNLDPGYQFQKDQGAQALRNADTPGVGALSGAALKDLISFNQGMASTGYQNAFNRYTTQQNNIFDRLNQIATLGQNAASNTGAAGTSLGKGIAQSQAAAGAARADGITGIASNLGQSSTLASLMSQGNGGWGGGGGVPDLQAGSGGDTGTLSGGQFWPGGGG